MPIIYVQESELRRNLSSLKRELKSLLELTQKYKWQLKEINDRLEGVIMRKKRKYTRKVVKSSEKLTGKVTTMDGISEPSICPKCSGTGLITADRAGIFARYCDCEAGQRKLAEKKRIFDK